MMMTIVAANLLDRWSLPDSPTYSSGDNNDGGGSGGWNFIMEYPVSNDIAEADNDMNIQIYVYDNGCRYNEGDTPVELLVGISEEVTFLTTTSESSVARLDLTLGGEEVVICLFHHCCKSIHHFGRTMKKDKNKFNFV